eukprot:UN01790
MLIEGLIALRKKVLIFRKCAIKLRFSVGTDEEKKSLKKNKLNKGLKDVLCHKIADILLIRYEQVKIGRMTFDEKEVEIEVMHRIPHEVGNDIEYVENMYSNQMEKVGQVISQIYELYNSNIEPKLITDKSSALMIMTSTSFRTPSLIPLGDVTPMANNGNVYDMATETDAKSDEQNNGVDVSDNGVDKNNKNEKDDNGDKVEKNEEGDAAQYLN